MQTKVSNHILADLSELIGQRSGESIFILVDENTKRLCLPKILELEVLQKSPIISIPAGDENKNLQSAASIWEFLSNNGALRSSLMINLGGGMITDIGGLTASCFKRGIEYINISTTLLGAVDAATGGKTGINHGGLKNEVGTFAPAKAVLIDTEFFKTLDDANIRSGYAEMVKHALISNEAAWDEILRFDLEDIDYDALEVLLKKNIAIKEQIVEQDPKEQGVRKALNLGHTFAHAFESLSYRLNRPVLHGYAVIWGLLCELYLSHIKLNFPQKEILRLRDLIKEFYGKFQFDCDHYEALYELMTHDKKNESKQINFTLLSKVGEVQINQTASREDIFECFDYLREA